ncbi:hypothetical protein ACFOG5_12810 [Pedobacter fastidiosus]|uniref:Uncharacterized protein n=1 Tax=Pedobacter fastidiosus TaxID=2765361 RepID=A0ABR7KMI1_9SPHI|nr:hypothetical protein [Pedobacter fastidiosus]MBC6109085.1 hypothetical protein [Pedobacter fastidiosus]
MKAQYTNKLAKKTVFVYKSVKDQNNFVTNPISDQSQTVVTNATFNINF